MASSIQQFLNKILSSRYGKDVRQAIHDAIHQCYEDGKAGSVDLIARERIDNLVANDEDSEGNSELIDIRVGYDGVRYKNAGEAVRSQMEESTKHFVIGKNLLDPSTIIRDGNGTINSTTGEIEEGSYYVYGPIKFVVGQSYTISRKAGFVGLYFYKNDGSYAGYQEIVSILGGTVYEKTFTPNYSFARLLAYNSEHMVQIEKGNKATEYEPFFTELDETVKINELMDLRKGIDDEVYDTAGEAVRKQIQKVTSNIEEIRKNANSAEYFKTGKNLLNPDTILKNGNGKFDSVTGTIGDDGSLYIYGFIELEVGTEYTVSSTVGMIQLAFFNSDKSYTDYTTMITSTGPTYMKTFTADYPLAIVICAREMTEMKAQLEEGNTKTEYEAYTITLKDYVEISDPNIVNHLLGEENVNTGNLADGSVTLNKTNFSERTYNMLNPDTCAEGYLNSSGTALHASTSFFTTDYIDINEDDSKIRCNKNFYSICFYDSDKSKIEKTSDGLNQNEYVIPSNSKYLRASFLAYFSIRATFCLYFGEEVRDYIQYAMISSEYIQKEENDVFPDVKIVMTKDIVLSKKVDICINHQSVIKNFDVKQSVISGNIQQNKFPTYDNITVLSGGSQPDGVIKFIHQPNYQIGMLTKDFNIINVDENAGSGQTKTVLFIGDSKTDANEYTQYLLDMFEDDPMSIKLIGTRGNNEANRHEGRSGWSAENYVENNAFRGVIEESPFWNPETEQFDFSYYMTHNSYDHVDYVFINLGTNDSYDNFIDYYHKLINGIREYDPNILIAMWIPAPFATFGGYTHRNNDNQTFQMMEAIIDEFDTDEYQNQKIFVVPTNMNINTYYDFKWDNVPYNEKHPEYTHRVCRDQIHEANGYNHVSDVIYGYIKYFATLD